MWEEHIRNDLQDAYRDIKVCLNFKRFNIRQESIETNSKVNDGKWKYLRVCSPQLSDSLCKEFRQSGKY